MKTFILISLLLISCTKQTIIITRGLPASGKTTFAKEYIKTHSNFIHIEKDVIRDDICNIDNWSQCIFDYNTESIVISRQFILVIKALENGNNIIVSNTHLLDESIEPFKVLANIYNTNLVIKDFRDIPLDICKKRNIERYEKTGKMALDIDDKYNKFIKLK